MSTPIRSETRLSSLEKVPSTILKPHSFAFAWPRGLFALLPLTTLFSGCARSAKVDAAPAPVVAVVNVARHNLANTLEIASEFLPFQEIDVYAKVSGYVQKLYVDWGTHVQEGQILADLEIPELQQQLQQDEATVHRGESDLERAQRRTQPRQLRIQRRAPDLHAACGRAENAAGAGGTGGYRRLAGQGRRSQRRPFRRQGFSGRLRTSTAGRQSRARKGQGPLRVLAHHRSFRRRGDRIHAYTGALLPAGTSSNIGTSALCQLSQNDLAAIGDSGAGKRGAGYSHRPNIAVNVSALGKTFTGKIVRFSDQIDTQTRTMHTEVQVPNPKFELVPGMYASVQIPLHAAENVLTVPIQAVQPTGDGKGSVLVVNSDNQIEKRDVTLGSANRHGSRNPVRTAGKRSVVFGSQTQYQPGQLVAPKVMIQAQEMEQ